jgi:hypothetical protein
VNRLWPTATLNISCQIMPFLPTHAMPCQHMPCHNKKYTAMPHMSCHNNTHYTMPNHAVYANILHSTITIHHVAYFCDSPVVTSHLETPSSERSLLGFLCLHVSRLTSHFFVLAFWGLTTSSTTHQHSSKTTRQDHPTNTTPTRDATPPGRQATRPVREGVSQG